MIREYSLFDDNGELISSTTTRTKRLRGNWIVFYTVPLRHLAIEAPNLSVLRIYLWLASKQTFDKYVMTTRAHMMKELNLTRNTLSTALKWLVENDYLIETVYEGNQAYILNPKISTRGQKGNDEKKAAWNAQFEEALKNARENARNQEGQQRSRMDLRNEEIERAMDRKIARIKKDE